MSSVIVTVNTPSDPSRLGTIYQSLVGFQIPGVDEATVELSLEELRSAIEELDIKLIGNVNWRVIEIVEGGVVYLAFGYIRPHDRPIETMQIMFEETDREEVRVILTQLRSLEGMDAFAA